MWLVDDHPKFDINHYEEYHAVRATINLIPFNTVSALQSIHCSSLKLLRFAISDSLYNSILIFAACQCHVEKLSRQCDVNDSDTFVTSNTYSPLCLFIQLFLRSGLDVIFTDMMVHMAKWIKLDL